MTSTFFARSRSVLWECHRHAPPAVDVWGTEHCDMFDTTLASFCLSVGSEDSGVATRVAASLLGYPLRLDPGNSGENDHERHKSFLSWSIFDVTTRAFALSTLYSFHAQCPLLCRANVTSLDKGEVNGVRGNHPLFCQRSLLDCDKDFTCRWAHPHAEVSVHSRLRGTNCLC